jgi:hypothetical protein
VHSLCIQCFIDVQFDHVHASLFSHVIRVLFCRALLQPRALSWTYEHGSAIVAIRTASGRRYDAAVSTAQMLILAAIDRLLSRPAPALAPLIDASASASASVSAAASRPRSVDASALTAELAGRLAPSTVASALLSLTADKHPLLTEVVGSAGEVAYAFSAPLSHHNHLLIHTFSHLLHLIPSYLVHAHTAMLFRTGTRAPIS